MSALPESARKTITGLLRGEEFPPDNVAGFFRALDEICEVPARVALLAEGDPVRPVMLKELETLAKQSGRLAAQLADIQARYPYHMAEIAGEYLPESVPVLIRQLNNMQAGFQTVVDGSRQDRGRPPNPPHLENMMKMIGGAFLHCLETRPTATVRNTFEAVVQEVLTATGYPLSEERVHALVASVVKSL